MTQNNHTNELYHYGVLGMKWGRRKKNYNNSHDSAKVQKIRKKSINQMSNQELRDVNNRLQLERQYKDLTRKKSVGKTAVQTFIGVAGTIAAIEGATKTYEKIGKVALGKIGKLSVK